VGHISTRDHGGGVAVLTVDRPPANAMDLTLLDEVVAIVQRLAGEEPRALGVPVADGLTDSAELWILR